MAPGSRPPVRAGPEGRRPPRSGPWPARRVPDGRPRAASGGWRGMPAMAAPATPYLPNGQAGNAGAAFPPTPRSIPNAFRTASARGAPSAGRPLLGASIFWAVLRPLNTGLNGHDPRIPVVPWRVRAAGGQARISDACGERYAIDGRRGARPPRRAASRRDAQSPALRMRTGSRKPGVCRFGTRHLGRAGPAAGPARHRYPPKIPNARGGHFAPVAGRDPAPRRRPPGARSGRRPRVGAVRRLAFAIYRRLAARGPRRRAARNLSRRTTLKI